MLSNSIVFMGKYPRHSWLYLRIGDALFALFYLLKWAYAAAIRNQGMVMCSHPNRETNQRLFAIADLHPTQVTLGRVVQLRTADNFRQPQSKIT
jgi:hypothetical protein